MRVSLRKAVVAIAALSVGITSCLTGVETAQAQDKNFIASELMGNYAMEQEVDEDSGDALPVEFHPNIEVKEQIPQEVTEFESASSDKKQDFKISDLNNQIDKEDAIPLDTSQIGKARSSVTEIHDSQQGYLSETDASQLYYLGNIAPGVLVQARLKQPANADLDYDLYILDSEGYILEGSENYTYINDNGTCPESVGVINKGAGAADYYFYVHSSAGGSTSEPYTIEYAISRPYDENEPDDNIARGKSFEIGTGGAQVSSSSISNPVDTDWCVITIPETRNYSKLEFSISTTSKNACMLEVYDDVNGYNQMRKRLSGDGELSVRTGEYYVRVIYADSDLDTFDSDDVENYTLTMKPVLQPNKIEITGYYCSDSNATYVSYPQGYHYRAVGSVQIQGYVVAEDAITGEKYGIEKVPVTGELYNAAYDEEEEGIFYHRTNNTKGTDDAGYFEISISFAPCRESFSYTAARTTHYYDMIFVEVFVTGRPHINAIDYIYQLGRVAP